MHKYVHGSLLVSGTEEKARRGKARQGKGEEMAIPVSKYLAAHFPMEGWLPGGCIDSPASLNE